MSNSLPVPQIGGWSQRWHSAGFPLEDEQLVRVAVPKEDGSYGWKVHHSKTAAANWQQAGRNVEGAVVAPFSLGRRVSRELGGGALGVVAGSSVCLLTAVPFAGWGALLAAVDGVHALFHHAAALRNVLRGVDEPQLDPNLVANDTAGARLKDFLEAPGRDLFEGRIGSVQKAVPAQYTGARETTYAPRVSIFTETVPFDPAAYVGDTWTTDPKDTVAHLRADALPVLEEVARRFGTQPGNIQIRAKDVVDYTSHSTLEGRFVLFSAPNADGDGFQVATAWVPNKDVTQYDYDSGYIAGNVPPRWW